MHVDQKEGESFESLLRRFSSKVKQDGLLAEYRRRRFFESKSVTERRSKARVIRKAQLKSAERIRNARRD